MFAQLIRYIVDAVKEPRVGFLSEPTAIVFHPTHRELTTLTLESWREFAKTHRAAAMTTGIVRDAKHGHSSAVVVVANVAAVIVVSLKDSDERSKFVDEFIYGERQGPRSLIKSDWVAARWNPPPPPPPPGYPPFDFLARLEAVLRILTVPLVSGTLERPINDIMDGH